MLDRIVVVEDDRELNSFLTEMLTQAGYEAVGFETADAALRALSAGDADLVITDLILPGMRGQELLTQLRQRRPELNIVIITAFGSIESAIELVKAGAYDYLTKPFGNDELLLTVQRALADSGSGREMARLSRAGSAVPPGFVGSSEPIRALFRLVQRAAHTARPVLITGESGAGKELVARALHQGSGRPTFVAVNCAALPRELLESELFGHERGAFTGATRDKKGLLEAAHRGTLFLDEIGELPLALQPKLLRALDAGEVRRLGASEPRHVDVRVIAATNRNLEDEVHEGRFREDLFWRLNVLHIHVPPLRERGSDIRLLAEQFLEASTAGALLKRRISAQAMTLLDAYPWPGNVRELRNAIEQAATLASGAEIRPEDLPPRVREGAGMVATLTDASARRLSLRDLERAYILEVVRQAEGNRSRAAEVLGLDRKTLYRKLEEYREQGVSIP
ncbi:MAG: sigma-54-dependent Fis family transcriptional regulator [Gemmatimonadetes bacterium]|nr:sigma-54-dependent Fis family transcriptional regulator [Gemmatimonadota bacterium]